MKRLARHAGGARGKAGFFKTFKKNLPLTLMALPALIVMFLFRYLPMSGLLLAFKRFSVRKGIFGSDWVWLDNFKFLFETTDAWVITRNTILYNVAFIVINTILSAADLSDERARTDLDPHRLRRKPLAAHDAQPDMGRMTMATE